MLFAGWCKTSTYEKTFPQDIKILGWCPVGSALSHGEKVPL